MKKLSEMGPLERWAYRTVVVLNIVVILTVAYMVYVFLPILIPPIVVFLGYCFLLSLHD